MNELRNLLAAWDAVAEPITLRVLPWLDVDPTLAARMSAFRAALADARAAVGEGADLDDLQRRVGEWARATFPNETEDGALLHLQREVAELLTSRRPDEAADCLSLLLGFAHRNGFSLRAEMERKFAINQARRWGAPDAEGVVEHVRDVLPDPPATIDIPARYEALTGWAWAEHYQEAEDERLARGQAAAWLRERGV